MRSLSLAPLVAVALGQYEHSFDFNNKYKLSWYWSDNNQLFNGKIEVQTTGWVGIGFAELTVGSMAGSDMIVASHRGSDLVFGDYYVDQALPDIYTAPKLDACQDHRMVSYSQEGGMTTLEFTKRLNTNDPQDRPLDEWSEMDGANAMIWAYGDDSSLSYHNANRGTMWVNLLLPGRPPIFEADESDLKTDIMYMTGRPGARDETPPFSIGTRETQYACRAVRLPDIDRTDIHIVSIDIVLDPSHSLQHHQLVHMCDKDGSLVRKFEAKPDLCGQGAVGQAGGGCRGLLYGWAPGVGVLHTPKEAGYRGGVRQPAFEYVIIEMHYDNPNGVRGATDNSGVKISYTKQYRRNDAATFTLGDPYISFSSLPAGLEKVHRQGKCPSQCTREWSTTVHIFGSELHMHKVGAQMWTTAYNGSRRKGYVGRAEYYDFNYQQLARVNVDITPGDEMYTHCHWNTKDRRSSTGMGIASLAEMCMHFVPYWPRQRFAGSDYVYCGHAMGRTLCGNDNSWARSFRSISNPGTGDPGYRTDEVRQFGQPCRKSNATNF